MEVVLLMPAELVGYSGYISPDHFDNWATLGTYESFTLAGIAGLNAENRRSPVYVHAKMMLVDGVWATIGSCNLHRYSLFGNGEMNVTFWSAEEALALRCELFQEHLGQDTSHMDDRAALQFFRKIAQENRRRLNSDNHVWQGLAFAIEPSIYGL